MEDSSPPALPWLVGASQLLGLASLVLSGLWMGHFHGGFAWDGSAREFNLHPLCMVLGLVFLQGDAILVYRVFRHEDKRNVKMLHGIIHLLALVVSIAGCVAVFDSHRSAKIPHMYSLHSWCGLLTLLLYCGQWVLGLLFFLAPGASPWLRAWYVPLHVFSGLVLLVLSVGTSLLGITEKLLFSLGESYSLLSPEGVLANLLGLLLLSFALLLGFIVTRDQYRRPAHPEEEPLAVHFKTLSEDQGEPASP